MQQPSSPVFANPIDTSINADQLILPPHVFGKIQAHFWPWILETPDFSIDDILKNGVRPFQSCPRHRLTYIPGKLGDIGFSCMASFTKGPKHLPAYLHMSCMAIRLTAIHGGPMREYWFSHEDETPGMTFGFGDITPEDSGFVAAEVTMAISGCHPDFRLLGFSPDGFTAHASGPTREVMREFYEARDRA